MTITQVEDESMVLWGKQLLRGRGTLSLVDFTVRYTVWCPPDGQQVKDVVDECFPPTLALRTELHHWLDTVPVHAYGHCFRLDLQGKDLLMADGHLLFPLELMIKTHHVYDFTRPHAMGYGLTLAARRV